MMYHGEVVVHTWETTVTSCFCLTFSPEERCLLLTDSKQKFSRHHPWGTARTGPQLNQCAAERDVTGVGARRCS